MRKFKVRCSAIGQIMTESRKKGELSKTAQSYCEQWMKEQIYGTRKEIYSKYMEKGIQMEDEAISMVETNYEYPFLFKNEKYFENDFMTGTPDIILPDMIRDTKCSWDCFSFPLFDTELDKGYYWQMQGYMGLTDRPSASVDYCLLNTPEDLDKFALDYSECEMKYRVKSFAVEYDADAVQRIYNRVEDCRDYIKSKLG